MRFRLPLTLLLACLGCLLGAAQAFAGANINNGTVRLGVNDQGHLNFSGNTPGGNGFFGVNYIPTGNDGTRAGCECEGWGAGAGGPTLFQGRANDAQGINNLNLVSFTSTASTATSVVDVLRSGTPALRVTHEFIPSPQSPNLYQIQITLQNLTAAPLTNVRYERLMDWDVEPTPFSEFVTINRGATPPDDLFYSDDNGFGDNFPFNPKAPLNPATVNTNYVDRGPADHGARFTFAFGDLAAMGPGSADEKTFFLFYGAAGTEASANTAVSAAALEMFSYGQPNGGQTTGQPNTFIWGFRAVGGAPVIPPTLTLTPESAENPVGTSHTVTAQLRTSTGAPVPGAKILFIVTGPNAQTAERTTDASGNATFTYTGNNAGLDDIRACFDANDNDACDRDEVQDTATKNWVGGTPVDRRWMAGEGRLTNGGGKKLDYAYIIECNDAKAPKFLGRLLNSSTQNLTVSDITAVSCTDDPSKTPAKAGVTFDTMEGTGTGKLGSTNVTVQFKFVDGGGPPDSNDSAYIKITNSATSAVIFEATGAPIPPYGGGTRPGRNTANEPPSPL